MAQGLSGRVEWKSPSNIALVKYWGKHGRQLPSNPSISFTLDKAHTITGVTYKVKENASGRAEVNFSFEGKEEPAFRDRIVSYLDSINDVLPIVDRLDLDIASSNSFPHSSGIASSASSMSALALCLLSIDAQINGKDEVDMKLASHIARLGSGSASRSVYGPLAIWGKTAADDQSSDLHAIAYGADLDPVFRSFHDDILIISKKKKSVSSTAGHALMDTNPYNLTRFDQAHTHMSELVAAMRTGDMEKFGLIVEKEALTLHALMMASSPPYILMEPGTIQAINEIKQFRKENKVPVYFTLDAGPNIHLLYPDSYTKDVRSLKDILLPLCEDGMILEDQVGLGPIQLA